MTVPATTADADTAGGRTAWRVALDPSFGPFFAGRLLSTAGMWAHSIVGAIVVFELTGSAFFVGLVSAAQFVPQFVLTPWSGSRSDRHDRRIQTAAGLLVAVAGSASLAAWFALADPVGTGGALAVIAGSTVIGIGFAVAAPSMQAIVPGLVPRADLEHAVALNSLTVLIGRAAGPAAGALLLALGSPAVGFAINGLTNLALALSLVLVRLRPVPHQDVRDGLMRTAVRYLRIDPKLAAALVGIAAVAIGSDPVLTLTPAMAEALGERADFAGVLATAFGIGSGVGFLGLGRLVRRHGKVAVGEAGLLLLAGGMVTTAVSPETVTALIALTVGGAGFTLALTVLTMLIHERVPEDLRGRVMALWTISWVGPRPLAAGASGALADVAHVRVAVALSGAAVVACVVVARRVARRASTALP